MRPLPLTLRQSVRLAAVVLAILVLLPPISPLWREVPYATLEMGATIGNGSDPCGLLPRRHRARLYVAADVAELATANDCLARPDRDFSVDIRSQIMLGVYDHQNMSIIPWEGDYIRSVRQLGSLVLITTRFPRGRPFTPQLNEVIDPHQVIVIDRDDLAPAGPLLFVMHPRFGLPAAAAARRVDDRPQTANGTGELANQPADAASSLRVYTPAASSRRAARAPFAPGWSGRTAFG